MKMDVILFMSMLIYDLIPNLFYSNLGFISRVLSIFIILTTPFIIYNVYSMIIKCFTYKEKKPPIKKYIIFDGLIGAGKTTLIKMLVKTMKSKGYKVKPIFEPVDVWEDAGALKLFYEDIKTHCYEFQTFTYITRIQRLLKEIDLNDDIEYYLIERSIFTDKYVFVELLKEQMGETRIEMYNIWWNMWEKLIPFKPSLFVMLDTSVDDSQDRLKIRNRAGEIVSNDYQIKLHKEHHNFYCEIKNKLGVPSIVIPSSDMKHDYIDNENHPILEKILDQIVVSYVL